MVNRPSRAKLKRTTRKLARLGGLPMAAARLTLRDPTNWKHIDTILAATRMYPTSISEPDSSQTNSDGIVTLTVTFDYTPGQQ